MESIFTLIVLFILTAVSIVAVGTLFVVATAISVIFYRLVSVIRRAID